MLYMLMIGCGAGTGAYGRLTLDPPDGEVIELSHALSYIEDGERTLLLSDVGMGFDCAYAETRSGRGEGDRVFRSRGYYEVRWREGKDNLVVHYFEEDLLGSPTREDGVWIPVSVYFESPEGLNGYLTTETDYLDFRAKDCGVF